MVIDEKNKLLAMFKWYLWVSAIYVQILKIQI